MAMLNNQMVNLPMGYNPQPVYSNPFQQSVLRVSNFEARMKVGMERVAESPSGEYLPHEVVMPRGGEFLLVIPAME